jgi:hypothetical protein
MADFGRGMWELVVKYPPFLRKLLMWIYSMESDKRGFKNDYLR